MANLAELLQPTNTEIVSIPQLSHEPSISLSIPRGPELTFISHDLSNLKSNGLQPSPNTNAFAQDSTTNGKGNSLSASSAALRKYKTLKRKFKALEDSNQAMQSELDKLKKTTNRLKREKNFLLDRLLQFEHISDSSDSDKVDSEAEIAEPPKKKARLNTNVPNGKSTGNGPTKAKKSTKEKPKLNGHDTPDSAQESDERLCTAKGKDNRPCRSKALSGFKYCWHHAPMDPNSPFIYCQYKDPKKNKSCNLPVLKASAQPFCNYHLGREAKKKQQEDQLRVIGVEVASTSSTPGTTTTTGVTHTPVEATIQPTASAANAAVPMEIDSSAAASGEEDIKTSTPGTPSGESGPTSPAAKRDTTIIDVTSV